MYSSTSAVFLFPCFDMQLGAIGALVRLQECLESQDVVELTAPFLLSFTLNADVIACLRKMLSANPCCENGCDY